MPTMTEEQKAKAKEQRTLNRLDNLVAPRFGLGSASTNVEENEIKLDKIPLSSIALVDPKELKPNPRNPYAPATPKQMALLTQSVAANGVVVPLLITADKKIICGHNRRAAAINAKLPKVPVQYIEMEVDEVAEKNIMRLENDLRRGGKWTAADKEEFVRANFFDEAVEDSRGGNRRGAGRDSEEVPFTKKVSIASRGEVTENDAERIKSKIRKEHAKAKPPKPKVAKVGVKALKKNQDSMKIIIAFHDIATFRKAERAIDKMAKTILGPYMPK